MFRQRETQSQMNCATHKKCGKLKESVDLKSRQLNENIGKKKLSHLNRSLNSNEIKFDVWKKFRMPKSPNDSWKCSIFT